MDCLFQMNVLHMDCRNLPERVKEWGAYHTLFTSLEAYLDLFPVLQQLNSKQIRYQRNRYGWKKFYNKLW